MRRFTLLVVLVAFTFSCGGQWYVLQGIAWANMIREYSRTVPLNQAVEMTLSGQYPCSLCKALAEKKQSDPSAFAFQKKEKKILVREVIVKVPGVPISEMVYFTRVIFFQTRAETPPTPPPRLA